jgi:hypothetical protein
LRCQNLILRVDLRVDLGGYLPHGRRRRCAARPDLRAHLGAELGADLAEYKIKNTMTAG